MYVPAVRLVLFSVPPPVAFAPLQAFDAVQLVGLPVVVQVSVVELVGNVMETGLALRDTLIEETGFTTTCISSNAVAV